MTLETDSSAAAESPRRAQPLIAAVVSSHSVKIAAKRVTAYAHSSKAAATHPYHGL